MEKRTVKIVFGDWSDDGHGRTDTEIVSISGEDVSDEALEAANVRTREEVGFGFEEVCSNYEEFELTAAQWEALQRAGFEPSVHPRSSVTFSTPGGGELGEAEEIGGLDFLMWWVGRHIENFSFELISESIPVLVGSNPSILTGDGRYSGSSFGYGLYFG